MSSIPTHVLDCYWLGSRTPRSSIREQFGIANTRHTVRVREAKNLKHKHVRYQVTRTNGPVPQKMHYCWRARRTAALVPSLFIVEQLLLSLVPAPGAPQD